MSRLFSVRSSQRFLAIVFQAVDSSLESSHLFPDLTATFSDDIAPSEHPWAEFRALRVRADLMFVANFERIASLLPQVHAAVRHLVEPFDVIDPAVVNGGGSDGLVAYLQPADDDYADPPPRPRGGPKCLRHVSRRRSRSPGSARLPSLPFWRGGASLFFCALGRLAARELADRVGAIVPARLSIALWLFF